MTSRVPRAFAPFLVAVVLAAPAAARAESVLVVGDSLEVGTGPHLRRALSGHSVRVDAEIGRPSVTGVRVLGDRIEPGDDVIVFDLGTNDDPSAPTRTAANLEAAARLAGDRCMVVSSITKPPLSGVPDTALNNAIEGFAASRPDTQLADWRALAQSRPELMQPDRVHATPEGYQARAQLLAEAVNACLADAGGSPPARKRSTTITFAGLEGELLLPSTRPPHRAVLMLPGSGNPTREELRPEAEYLVRQGFAALIFDKRTGDPDYAQLTTDARAGIAELAKREDVEDVALWGFGEGGLIAARAAAGNQNVKAIVAVSPPGFPELTRQDWATRSALDASGTAAVTTMYRLAADSHEGDLTADPAAAWRQVRQPTLVLWGGRDRTLPARESAMAVRDALDGRARFVVDPDAGHGVEANEAAAAFLEDPKPGPTPVPAASATEPREITDGSALAKLPVQLAWLLLPIVLILVAAVRKDLRKPWTLVPTAAALVVLGASLAAIENGNHSKLAGVPAGLLVAGLLATVGAVLTGRAIRTAPLTATASALWLALAAYWLL